MSSKRRRITGHGSRRLTSDRFALNQDGTVKPKAKIYLLFGQSNSTGQGNYGDLPTSLQGEQPDSYIVSGKADSQQPRGCFEKLIPGFNSTPNPNISLNYPFVDYASMNGNGKHGVEVTLSDGLAAKYNEPVYCVKFGAGGVAVTDDPTKDDWSTLTNELYGTLISDVLPNASACLCDAGLRPDWLGAVWIQGERDRTLGTSTADYQEAERLLVNQLRLQMGIAGLPFVSFLLPDFAADSTAVNDAKTNNAAAIANYFALPGGTTHIGDSIHYDSAALQSMGTSVVSLL